MDEYQWWYIIIGTPIIGVKIYYDVYNVVCICDFLIKHMLANEKHITIYLWIKLAFFIFVDEHSFLFILNFPYVWNTEALELIINRALESKVAHNFESNKTSTCIFEGYKGYVDSFIYIRWCYYVIDVETLVIIFILPIPFSLFVNF